MEQATFVSPAALNVMETEVKRFMMTYEFAIDEVSTKIDSMKQEFQYIYKYNPIKHVESRLKSLESISGKLQRKNLDSSLSSIKEHIKDIAGLRIVCSFISDIYRISDLLQQQKDIQVLALKDYINHPKPNGYQSLHLIVQVPVFVANREEQVCAEIQIRTIAMDLWASLEHKVFYKYEGEVPAAMVTELKEAANFAASLDRKMERIYEITGVHKVPRKS